MKVVKQKPYKYKKLIYTVIEGLDYRSILKKNLYDGLSGILREGRNLVLLLK